MKKLKFDKKLCLNLMAEFVGSSMYMSIGCLAEGLYLTKLTTGYAGLAGGIAFACAVVIVYQCFKNSSGGHANPSVTCAAVILNKIKWVHGLLYMLMHLLGTMFGFGIAFLLRSRDDTFVRRSLFCVQVLKNEIPLAGAIVIEFFATCAVIFGWCAALDDRNQKRQDSMALRLGIVLIGTTTAASKYAGGCANILRSLIPALASEFWTDLWVFVVAPIIPSIAIPFLWRYVMSAGPDADKGAQDKKNAGLLGEIKK